MGSALAQCPLPQPCCPTCPTYPPRPCRGSSRPPPSLWRDPAASSTTRPTLPMPCGWWWRSPTVSPAAPARAPSPWGYGDPHPHGCCAASGAFRNPPSRADVPLYERLPTAHSYMTLETPVHAFACSAPSPAPLRVGGDTACEGQEPCNGPLPSPGPYRVKFLVMGCQGPRAETRWSEPILLRRASSLSTIDPVPLHRSSAVVVITSILASLGAVLAAAVLGAVGAKAWGSLHRRDSGTSTHRSYRTHHIPPALSRPPGCRCSPPGLCCFAPRPPAPCPAE
ncbi:uroplakin-3b-like [Pezoporus flaviventris]|uniref:uroplakin-3b-like n=1 Tax=Pezoporus flaviventris TaxID=889875 RepID=UPI002AB25CCC|nr:uroplakin-3b-like [Pezoporus flaviventris]